MEDTCPVIKSGFTEKLTKEFPNEIQGCWLNMNLSGSKLVVDDAGPSYRVYSNIKTLTDSSKEISKRIGVDVQSPKIKRILVVRCDRDGRLMETRIYYGETDDLPGHIIKLFDDDIIQDAYLWQKGGRQYCQVNYYKLTKM